MAHAQLDSMPTWSGHLARAFDDPGAEDGAPANDRSLVQVQDGWAGSVFGVRPSSEQRRPWPGRGTRAFQPRHYTCCGEHVRLENGSLDAMAIADRPSRSVSTWESSSALAFTHRKQCARWIAQATREETLQRRVQQALAMIRAGKAALDCPAGGSCSSTIRAYFLT
jgi:hypothetical protein